ncbi:MAG: hypothetical protein NTX01_05460 [Candidatus Omnitrophica bacterium]|nr:hypothetical protein [Candidatus Omnitrophota bacterium]
MARFLDREQNVVTRYQVRFSILLLVIVTVLYGATYQQFRHFNIEDPRGAQDALSYIKMSHGNYNVPPIHQYRLLIPYMASLVQKALHPLVANEKELDKLSFYVVNFVVATGTALLLFGVLTKLGFEWQLSILGTIFFLISRITVLSVGTPLVDSLYFFAIVAIVYLMLYEKVVLLACLCPLFVLFKETIIPFLFLPFVIRSMRNWKMVSSVLFSLSIFFVARHIMQREIIASQPCLLVTIVIHHAQSYILLSLRRLFTPAGIHDLFNGFAFLAVFAPLGLLVDWRYRKYKIPAFLLLPILIAFGFALLNGAMGRMFFAAYVPIIAYSLILIEHVLEEKSKNHE